MRRCRRSAKRQSKSFAPIPVLNVVHRKFRINELDLPFAIGRSEYQLGTLLTRVLSLALVSLATSALVSCNRAEEKADPVRAEFVSACEGRIEYSSMEPGKRTAYCKCGYDKTMNALSEEEKQFARFYLLAQVGVDVRSRKLISKSNTQAMMKATEAIGNAVKRCG